MVLMSDMFLINTLVVKASTINICGLIKKNYRQMFYSLKYWNIINIKEIFKLLKGILLNYSLMNFCM